MKQKLFSMGEIIQMGRRKRNQLDDKKKFNLMHFIKWLANEKDSDEKKQLHEI